MSGAYGPKHAGIANEEDEYASLFAWTECKGCWRLVAARPPEVMFDGHRNLRSYTTPCLDTQDCNRCENLLAVLLSCTKATERDQLFIAYIGVGSRAPRSCTRLLDYRVYSATTRCGWLLS